MKKTLGYFILFLLLACCVSFGLLSCAKEEGANSLAACPEAPEHIWSASLLAYPDGDNDGEMAYSCVNCGAFYTEPVPHADLGEFVLTIDPTGMTRVYDSNPVRTPSFRAMLGDTEVDPFVVTYQWYVKNGSSYEEISGPPSDAGSYRLTISASLEVGDHADEDSVDFTVIHAPFPYVDADEFTYTGANVFEMLPVRGCGEDMIGYTVMFESGNAGAAVDRIILNGDNAGNYAVHEDYTAAIIPKTVNISTLTGVSATKTYDATSDFAISLNRSVLPGIEAHDGDIAVICKSEQIDVCNAAPVTFTVKSSCNGNYTFTGSASAALTVTAAEFTPPASFVYNGSATMSATVPTGLGNDQLTYQVVFADKNVGAAMIANGATLSGNKAGNYCVPGGYAPVIVPKPVDLSELSGMRHSKRFDGTSNLSLVLTNAEYDFIAPGDSVTLIGDVGVTMPCVDVPVLFTATTLDDADNYVFQNSFPMLLTVKKAVLTLEGEVEHTYNSIYHFDLAYDAAYASGRVEGYPVYIRVCLDSPDVGAEVASVSLIGEYKNCYEIDWSEFSVSVLPKTIRLTTKAIKYPYNGEAERMEVAGRSYRMISVCPGDDVTAVLRFAAADVGSALESVTLVGAQADNYSLDVSELTAEIVQAPAPVQVTVQNIASLRDASFHPGAVLDPVYTPSTAEVVWYRLTNDGAEPLAEKPNEVGNYRVTVTVAGSGNYADSGVSCDFSIVAHNYVLDTENSIERGCLVDGLNVYKCACGDGYNEVAPAIGSHDYQLISNTATCEQGGIATYECSACGDVYTEASAAAHQLNEYGICEAAGCSHYAGDPITGQKTYSLAPSEKLYISMELSAGTYQVDSGNANVTVQILLWNGSTYTPQAGNSFTVETVAICYITLTNTTEQTQQGTAQVN